VLAAVHRAAVQVRLEVAVARAVVLTMRSTSRSVRRRNWMMSATLRSEAVLLREDAQVGQARHRAVLVHDLADHGHRRAAGHAREVHRALGLARAAQHAARHRAQREDVARAHEILRLAGRIHGGTDRPRAVGGADAGGHSRARLDRDRERRAHAAGVALHLQRQVQPVREGLLHRQADQAARVARHEVHDLRRDQLREAHEVASFSRSSSSTRMISRRPGSSSTGHGWKAGSCGSWLSRRSADPVPGAPPSGLRAIDVVAGSLPSSTRVAGGRDRVALGQRRPRRTPACRARSC
jgi:hypothetical protein